MISNFYVLAIACIFLSNASEETDKRLNDNDSYSSFEISENLNDSVEDEITLLVKKETDEVTGSRNFSLKRFVKAMDEVQLENAENPVLKNDQTVESEQKDEVLECYICNEEMTEKFQYCEHPTHACCLECAQKWKDSCPMFRNEIGGGLKKSESPRIQNHSNHLPEILLDLSRDLNSIMRDREEIEINKAIYESIRQNNDAPRSNFGSAYEVSKCFQCKTEPASCKKSSQDIYGFCESCVISQIVEDESIGRENNILNPQVPSRPRHKPSFFCRIVCCRKAKPANQNQRLNKM